jgi:hypothetical protein
LSDDEFWSSTMAKVRALYEVQVLEWNRTRDFFPSLLASMQLKDITPEKILLMQYPMPKKNVIIALNDGPKAEHGTIGSDWQDNRMAMRAFTNKGQGNG